MTKFAKLNSAIDRMEARMDAMDAAGIDYTTDRVGGRNLVAEGLRKEAASLNAKRERAANLAASTWTVGQSVITRRGEHGLITAVDGATLSIDFDGTTRKFAAAMVRAA